MSIYPSSISQNLAKAKPVKLASRHFNQRSAVAILVDQDQLSDASLLLIKRAESPNDPWSGHMAFPGGRLEKGDRNGLATAKREMYEEIGFDIDAGNETDIQGECIGRLSDLQTVKKIN